MIAIMDYGIGNLGSVKNAFDYLGFESHITSDINEILNADKVILPGVGAFKDAIDTFKKYGFIKCHYENIKFDITTLRIEGTYKDSRHPSKIKYVTDLKKDYIRRDFTINAMYLDSYFILYDYCNGQEDLKNHLIRFVGKPKARIKEDPLRIIRAIRFALIYGFAFEEKTEKAMKKYSYLLDKLNKDKIKEEVHKIKDVDKSLKEKLLKEYNINKYLD